MSIIFYDRVRAALGFRTHHPNELDQPRRVSHAVNVQAARNLRVVSTFNSVPIRIQWSTSACVDPLFSENQKRRADNLVDAFGCVFACLDDPLFEATFLMSVVDEDPSQLTRSRCLVGALTRTFLDDVCLTRHWVVERLAAETVVFSTSTSRVLCREGCTSKLSTVLLDPR